MSLIALCVRAGLASTPNLALPAEAERLDPVQMSEAAIADWWRRGAEAGLLSAEAMAGDWRVRAVFTPHGRSMLASSLIDGDLWSDLAFSSSGVCRFGRQVHRCGWMADPTAADPEGPPRWAFVRWGDRVVALAPDVVQLYHHGATVESLVVLERLSDAPSYMLSESMGPGLWPPEHAFRRMTPPLPLWSGGEARACRIGLGVSGTWRPSRMAEPVLLDVWGCPEPDAALVREAIGCWRLHRPARPEEGIDYRIWYVETVTVPEPLSGSRRCGVIPAPSAHER